MQNSNDCPFSKMCNHVDCDKDLCMRRFKMTSLFDLALMSDKQRMIQKIVMDGDGTDLNEFSRLKAISKDILNFIEGGNNLYIHSQTCGNGKTSWALRMLQSYIYKIWPHSSGTECKALFINVPRFLLALKDNITQKSEYVQHIKDNILSCDLVVWDEVGSKGLTQYEHENFLSLLNARVDSGKSNIFTSNLDDKELHESVGDRLYSRIVNNSECIELHGSDKRGLRLEDLEG